MGERLCVFRLGEWRFAVPVEASHEVIRTLAVAPVPRAGADVAGLLNLRGRLVTVVDLGRRLGLPPAALAGPGVLVQLGDSVQCWRVDGVDDVVFDDGLAVSPPVHLPGPVFACLRAARAIRGQLVLLLDPELVRELSREPPSPRSILG